MDHFASLEGKVALITGAAAGIGAACARELAVAGATVMFTDVNLQGCRQLSVELQQQGMTAFCARHDVASEEDWQRVINETLNQCGGLDVLVNNAGVYLGGTLVSNSLESVRRVHQVNVDSIFLGMKYAALAMKPGGAAGNGGSIINLSSVAGIIGLPGHTAYGSTKGAVRLYTKHAAVEFARFGYGIRVNSVHPGLIETSMGDQLFKDFVGIGLAVDPDAARSAVIDMTPIGRLGQPQDVANMVRFLASEASAYCTGSEFVIDGGMSAA